MKLLLIRHGDPDYEIDSLTEKGWREAQLLAQRIEKLEVAAFYVSPLGRAKDTASLTLKAMGREATELPWLREFHAPIPDDNTGEMRIPWDQLPGDWTQEENNYDHVRWAHSMPMLYGHVWDEAKRVWDGFDEILEQHGYVRQGHIYRAVNPNEDTLVFFCHFGVTCVILSHLLGISPMILWHHFCAAPTSVTSLITEERREGIAVFRMNTFGDTAHLYANDEPPAFAARFCETYRNVEQRHD